MSILDEANNLISYYANCTDEEPALKRSDFEVIEFTYGVAVYHTKQDKWYDLITLNGQEINLEALDVKLTEEGIKFNTHCDPNW